MISTRADLQVARLHAVDAGGVVTIAVPGPDEGAARTRIASLAIDLSQSELEALAADGAEVLVGFADERERPVIVGVLRERARPDSELPAEIVLEARERLVVRCGSARIVLSGDGRIEVLGERVSQRARGVHSIKGSAVRIN
ncbi:MAG TPA: hypothetical protein VMI75_12600 [Polyangiaceae bacterium]|nr:hypothetical protein [Polyangiaceae bacterium]